jgi:hypothetical protein
VTGSAVPQQPLDSLDIAELQRIEQAVRSLIEDLQYGSAVTVNTSSDTFTWRTEAARVFSPVKRLEEHEQVLIRELQRAVAQSELISKRLGEGHPAVAALQQFQKDKAARAEVVADLGATLTLDTAAVEQQALDRELGKALEPAYAAHREAASLLFDLTFAASSIAQYDNGAAIWVLRTVDGEPQLPDTAEFGVVLLAQGTHERVVGDALKFARSFASVRKLVVVHVLPPGSTAEECAQLERRYLETANPPPTAPDAAGTVSAVAVASPASTPQPSIVTAPYLPVRAKALSLDELPQTATWGHALGQELVLQSYWATYRDKTIAVPGGRAGTSESELDKFLTQPRGPEMTLIIEGVTEPDLVFPVIHRELQDHGPEVTAVTLDAAANGVVSVDEVQRRKIAGALRASTAAQAESTWASYETAAQRLLFDETTVVVSHGSAPLTRVVADSLGHNTRLLYIGPFNDKQFFEAGRGILVLQSARQFTTQSGAVGTYATQELTLHWGRFPRAKTDLPEISVAPAA